MEWFGRIVCICSTDLLIKVAFRVPPDAASVRIMLPLTLGGLLLAMDQTRYGDM